jgi:hypothetical protein
VFEPEGKGRVAGFRTPVTGLASRELARWTEAQSGLVDLRSTGTNQVLDWVRQMEALRRAGVGA